MINTAYNFNKDRRTAKSWSAGLYLRLSRDDDKYESESISSQRDILNDFVSKNPDITVYDIYIDDGWSGTNFDRPNFRRMEDDLRAKKIDCIIVKDLSRFARNCSEIGNYLSVVFPYLKTRFICIYDNVDSYLDPESLDNITTKFKNLINEEYCHDISVKVKSSLTIRRESGEYIGSFALYGYQKDPVEGHKMIIDEEPAEIVRLIYKRFLAGESIRGICKSLNESHVLCPAAYKKKCHPTYNPYLPKGEPSWTTRTVTRILSNRMYVGDLVQNVMNNISYKMQTCRPVDKENWIIVPNTHEAIISKADFEAVQSLLKRDTRVSPKTQQLNILAGFIKCGDCKRGMMKKNLFSGYKMYGYYRCSTYQNRGKNLCTKHVIRADKVEQAVLAYLQMNIKLAVELEPILKLINSSPERIKISEKYNKQISKIEAELRKITSLKEDLYPDYKAGLIDIKEYESFRKKYDTQIEELEEQMVELKRRVEEIKNGVSHENAFISNFKKIGNITELSREIVCALIDNIYVYEGNRIEIVLKYQDEFETILEYLIANKAYFEFAKLQKSLKAREAIGKVI